MRLVQLHDEDWDSGIAHYAVTLAAALRSRGHDVQFWSRAGSYSAAQGRTAGLEVREISGSWTSLPELRAELGRRGTQLINAHTGSAHSLAAALAAGTEIKVVRTRGDTRPPKRHFLAQALARRTDAYIAANRHLRDGLLEAFPDARVELVFQGIAPLGAPAPLPVGSATVGILGRLDPVKGHVILMEAAAQLSRNFSSAAYLAAGTGKPDRLVELNAKVLSLGLEGCFEFLGQVADVAAFINRCSVGVVASNGSEAVSRAALEWMQLGRPVVATHVGCLPDIVEEGRTGLLIPPNDAQAMAKALTRLFCDPKEAAEMGRRGRERFEKCFSLERFAEETENVYKSVLA